MIDREMLEELLLEDELEDTHRQAFESMLSTVCAKIPLTAKQRAYVIGVRDKLGLSTPANLFSEGLVPIGNPVEKPKVLQHLPKRPPTRRCS